MPLRVPARWLAVMLAGIVLAGCGGDDPVPDDVVPVTPQPTPTKPAVVKRCAP